MEDYYVNEDNNGFIDLVDYASTVQRGGVCSQYGVDDHNSYRWEWNGNGFNRIH